MSDKTASVDVCALLQAESEALPARPRGRPPGSGNKSLVTEKRVRQHNNARSYCDKVVKGGRIKAALVTGGKERDWCYPTVRERLKAAEIQLRDASAVQAVLAAEGGVQMGPAAIVNIQIINRVAA